MTGPYAVAFRTLGCKVNQVESEAMAAQLLGSACTITAEEDARVVVVNTCTVTGEADRKARKEVRRALRLPNEPVVVVTGCLATLDAEGLRALGPRAVIEADKTAVAARVAAILGVGAETPARGATPGATTGATIAPRVGGAFHTRAMVKVEDGCDAYCAYCIVPYARGASRSMPLRDVVAEVEALVAAGTAEIVLTGINIGRYRDGSADLADLVHAVAGTGVPRIRLSSIEPLDVPGRLLEVLASTPAACPHLHVPLQSGCDRVLRAMDRGYDTRTFSEVLAEARDAIPGLALTTDVLVGFPGESPAEAVEARTFVEGCGFMRLHVFRYSARPGTIAAEMPGQIDPRDRASRAERMRETGARLGAAYAASRVGGMARVLVERTDGTTAEGTSEDYLRVRFPARDSRIGDVVAVTVGGLGRGHVTGRW